MKRKMCDHFKSRLKESTLPLAVDSEEGCFNVRDYSDRTLFRRIESDLFFQSWELVKDRLHDFRRKLNELRFDPGKSLVALPLPLLDPGESLIALPLPFFTFD